MIPFLIVLSTFLIMEGVTWCTHKFVMHGFLWNLHYDHHNKNKNQVLEKNDWFFVYFAIISMSLFATGSYFPHLWFNLYIGVGILCYGLAYFAVHEVIIHKRLLSDMKFDFFYFKALQRAHRNHHSRLGKEDGECFGMLWVPVKYFKEAYQLKSA